MASYLWRSARLARTVLDGKPAICTLQVTNRCNMRCSFCAFWSDGAPPPEELTLAQVERISDRLAEVGSFIVSVEGGEPMLRPDLADCVRALARHHHPMLYTNGWFADRERARELVEAGLVGVGVSLDFAAPERHDAHRLPGSYARVLAAVENFKLAARRHPAFRRQIHLMTVLMDDNAGELDALFALSARLDVRHRLTVIATEGHNRAGGKAPPRESVSARLRALKAKWPHFAAVDRYLDGVDAFLAGRFDEPCLAGRRGFNINHVGETNPCIELTDVSVGKFLDLPIDEALARLAAVERVRDCQKCYTVCRGNVQALARPLHLRSLAQLVW